jgi:hypothetical protein
VRNKEDKAGKIERGIRLDFVIAICALGISTLAAGASWFQTRVMVGQARLLEQQAGAQIWPYVSFSTNVSADSVRVTLSNDGLGPAVLRSLSASVDGVAQSSYIGILHALLGPHLVARRPAGEKLSFTIDGAQPGSVVRPGATGLGFSLTNKTYARQFLKRYSRLNFHTCYCAIVPGKCWLSDSASVRDPEPVTSCPEMKDDLLHASAANDLMRRDF